MFEDFLPLIKPLTPRELDVTGNSRWADPGSVGMNILTTVLHRSKKTDASMKSCGLGAHIFFVCLLLSKKKSGPLMSV